MHVHQRTRIKICGITRVQDAQIAIEAGADAIGFICYPPSSRHITLEALSRLGAVAGPFVTTVAVVVDPRPDYLRQILDTGAINTVQFHGEETAEFCASWTCPWIKGVRVKTAPDWDKITKQYRHARGLLVDAWDAQFVGGTGKQFDWDLLRGVSTERLVLAGGLTPENIGEAVRTVRPCAVDVSTGVEIEPGIKDAAKIQAFVEQVRKTDQAIANNH